MNRWNGRYASRVAVSTERRLYRALLSSSSGWSRVLRIDAIGGPPHCDFANQGGGMTSRSSPGWRAVTSADVILDLVGEVGDKLRSLGQVGPPDGIGLERRWYARQPGQRTWVDRRQRWNAPVEHGRHVVCGSKIACVGGCQHVAEWVLSTFGRKGEQMCPQGRPSRFGGEPRNVVVGLVEFSGGLVAPALERGPPARLAQSAYRKAASLAVTGGNYRASYDVLGYMVDVASCAKNSASRSAA